MNEDTKAIILNAGEYRKFLSNVSSLTYYMLDDEEHNFWENCECEHFDQDDAWEKGEYEKCTCDANAKHIYKFIMTVEKYINKELDKEELK